MSLMQGKRPGGSGSGVQTPDGSRLRFLDGTRAIAVTAVLLFHGGVPGVSGGLLGVDIFFVLSGFLITGLLCREFVSKDRLSLQGFWARRARRILPPVFLVIIGVAVYAWIFRYSLDLPSIRSDSISTLLFVANWHFILSSQGYFAQAISPSPLLHMWSLAVEEQYYLIWPLVALFLLRKKGPRLVAVVAGIGAVASAVEMAILHFVGTSTDRLYYGTDTRAQALLVGSMLGAIAATRDWRVVRLGWSNSRPGRGTGLLLQLACPVALLWAMHAFNGQDTFLYEGGFFLVALATGGLLVCLTSWQNSLLATTLSLKPVVYVGRISYGLYVYHWPLFLAINHSHTGLTGASLLAVRLASTFAAAVLSFHLIELPVRRWQRVPNKRGLVLACTSCVLAASLAVVATIPPAFADVAVTKQPTHISNAEHLALEKDRAFASNPIRFLLLGDSVAFTAAQGLMVDSVPRYGVEVIDRGILGCNLTSNAELLGGVDWGITPPGVNCGSWPTVWAKEVHIFHPTVVGLLLGRFELADSNLNGKWVSVGDVQWDNVLLGYLRRVVSVLSSSGAKVVIFTFPYIDPPLEQANGDPWPENMPSRVNAWNALLRQVADEYPKTTTLIDLNHILGPDGNYTNVVDGVEVRLPSDGIHVTIAGGEWLQPRILPQVAALGLTTTQGSSEAGSP